MGRAHDDEEKHHGQDDLRHQTAAQSIFARRVVAESIRGESFGNVKVRRSARDYVQQGGGCNRANDLRRDVGQDLMSRKTAAACQSNGHRGVEMTSRDMPDAIRHGGTVRPNAKDTPSKPKPL